MISTEPSVEPPSTTMYSRFSYAWSSTDRSVRSRNAAWFNDGVTIVSFGLTPAAAERTTRASRRTVIPASRARSRSVPRPDRVLRPELLLLDLVAVEEARQAILAVDPVQGRADEVAPDRNRQDHPASGARSPRRISIASRSPSGRSPLP